MSVRGLAFERTFDGAISFSQNISSWGKNSAEHLIAMSQRSSNFNQAIKNLNASSVRTIDISDIETTKAYGFVINGADGYDYSGASVSGAGDVNGDGLDDLIIGAYYADANTFNSGSSYVVFGTSDTSAIELST